MWMLNTDLQQAQLQLNPKHLGRLEIKISMTSDQQINVSFLTHNTNAKDALDQALPRLREGFDQSGLNLNDVTVQQESRNQNREQHHSAGQTPMEDSRLAENMPEDGQMAQIFHSQSISSSIVDFYA
jgi:flagellar hook-length control protein FliK